MAITINDAEDAYLGGKARFERWQKGFEQKFFGPQMEMMLKVWWGTRPPEWHAMMQAANPEAYKIISDRLVEKGA